MTERWSRSALDAILDALEGELIEAPEAEIAAVLQELGLRPGMAGSVALFELLGYGAADGKRAKQRRPDDGPILPFPITRETRRPN